MASLALPSAVSVAPRFQSQRSQVVAFLGSKCPQYGHGILSPVVGSDGAVCASVYSTLISIIEGRQAEFVKQTCSWPQYNASVESTARIERRASSFFGFSAQVLGAGLNSYTDLIAKDPGPMRPNEVR